MMRRFRRDDRGAAMIEMAIISPILLALLAGVVEVGRALYYHETTLAAVRGAARLAARFNVSSMPSNARLKELVMAKAGISPDDLVNAAVTVTVVPDETVNLRATVTYRTFVHVLGQTITFVAEHQEPHVPECKVVGTTTC